jgi:hypothetical protein
VDRSKYLSPWTPYAYDRLARFRIDRVNTTGLYWIYGAGQDFCATASQFFIGRYSTLEEAIGKVDSMYMDKEYILLTQEQFDKLRVLI